MRLETNEEHSYNEFKQLEKLNNLKHKMDHKARDQMEETNEAEGGTKEQSEHNDSSLLESLQKQLAEKEQLKFNDQEEWREEKSDRENEEQKEEKKKERVGSNKIAQSYFGVPAPKNLEKKQSFDEEKEEIRKQIEAQFKEKIRELEKELDQFKIKNQQLSLEKNKVSELKKQLEREKEKFESEKQQLLEQFKKE